MLPIILPSIKKYFNYVPLAIVVTVYKYLSYFHICKQWDLLNENSTMSHWTEYLLLYILIFYIYKICKQWDLLNCKNSTMSHWKKSLLTFLFKLKYKICKQWDLNPHSFTLLFPKNSLSTNFNMLTLLYTKNPLP